MQYILQDLIKLPLCDRVRIIELVINSVGESGADQQYLSTHAGTAGVAINQSGAE